MSQEHGSEDPDPDPPQNVRDPNTGPYFLFKTVILLLGILTEDVNRDAKLGEELKFQLLILSEIVR